jgi:hypothetical protein
MVALRAMCLVQLLQSKVRLLARRGTALSQLGKYDDALKDFQAAGALDRTDPTFATIAGELSRFAECMFVGFDCERHCVGGCVAAPSFSTASERWGFRLCFPTVVLVIY